MSNIIEISPDFDSVCRCCLKSEELVEIYRDGTDLNPVLEEVILPNYIPVKVDDLFPNYLCTNCLDCLRQWHRFRSKCEESSRILEGLLNECQLEILEDPDSLEEEIEEKDVKIEEVFLDEELDSIADHISDSPDGDHDEEPSKPNSTSRKCPICNIPVPRGLKEHLLTHEDPTGRPFRCDQCDKSYCRSANLRLHREKEHLQIRYPCPVCGKVFTTKDILAVHQKLHDSNRQYRCDQCGQTFNSNKYLYKHQQKHRGERKFVCSYCGKAFMVGEYLKNHLRIHTGEKPYPCKQCGKSFRISNQLRQHMRTHLPKGERVASGKEWSVDDSKQEVDDDEL
ncbi:zinc finger protein 551 [Culex quinquefasciatus]|uniref:zinc finger protein 551 n=1 Tax=Culex quinquefasciatus TaxID=7176 RepID=UPI0018E3A446|nr:zinc finger protein 551 [Culex quinquefasciatus]